MLDYLGNWLLDLYNEYVESWGYVILFFWSVLEGELGLVSAGLASHDGKLNVFTCVIVAGLGGFVGDQIYFYTGRLNKRYVQRKLVSQRRKFARATILMRKYGWKIIFVQRYMYGLRTIIPISIGLTNYGAVRFAIINFISAMVWSSMTIVPVWYYGREIVDFAKRLSAHLGDNSAFICVVVLVLFLALLVYRRRVEKYKKDT